MITFLDYSSTSFSTRSHLCNYQQFMHFLYQSSDLLWKVKFSSISVFLLQKSMKGEHFLWKLFNIHNDYAETIKDLEDEEKSREGVVKELEYFESEASKKKKEQAKYLKEIALREKRIAEKGNKLDKSVSVFSTFGVGGL